MRYRIKLKAREENEGVKPVFSFRGPLDSIKLFNAMFLMLKIQDERKANDFVKRVDKGEISISSAFPSKEDSLYFYFPLNYKSLLITGEEQEGTKLRKKIKSQKYISSKKLFSNNLSVDFLREELKNDGINKLNLINETEMPKNSLERYTLKSNIFYTSVSYGDEISFLVDSDKEAMEELIRPALKLLSFIGIGADHNTGKGSFEFEIKHFETPERGSCYLLLSKLIPTNINNAEDYKLKEFKALTREGKHVRGIILIEEGSIFSSPDKGKLYTPDTPQIHGARYFVNGKGFYIKIPCLGEKNDN